MKLTTIPITLVLLAGGIASAEPGPVDGRRNRRPPPIPPMLEFFDTDRDGRLSDAEVAKASNRLDALGHNSDGEEGRRGGRPPHRMEGGGPRAGRQAGPRVGRQAGPQEGRTLHQLEGAGPRAGRPPHRPEGAGPQGGRQGPPPFPGMMPPPPLLGALDQDRDGTISAEEMTKAAESLTKLDVNDDGELTPEELHPHGPPPPPPGETRGRPPGPPPGFGRRPD